MTDQQQGALVSPSERAPHLVRLSSLLRSDGRTSAEDFVSLPGGVLMARRRGSAGSSRSVVSGWARRVRGVDWLGEDLLLLALDAGRGRLERVFAISYGLMGAELVRLAACGRIGFVDDRVVVNSPAPTGDAELDAALARIGELDSPPWVGDWVQRVRPRITGRYLERLIAAGVVCEQARFGVIRWPVTNTARLAEARQRLDLIAWSAGPVDLSQTAYAGLACAIGLDRVLYPGRGRRAERGRLREIAAGRWTTSPALASDSADADATSEAARTAREAATLAAIGAATYAVAAVAAALTASAMGGDHGA